MKTKEKVTIKEYNKEVAALEAEIDRLDNQHISPTAIAYHFSDLFDAIAERYRLFPDEGGKILLSLFYVAAKHVIKDPLIKEIEKEIKTEIKKVKLKFMHIKDEDIERKT